MSPDHECRINSALQFVRDNYTEGAPIILYGYSMGGVLANQVAKMLGAEGYTVDNLITVDAAFGPLSRPLEIPSNVEEHWNYYQTDRSKIGSRGYPSERMEGNESTEMHNMNWDMKKSQVGFKAHGAMDEDTQHRAKATIVNEVHDWKCEQGSEKDCPPEKR